MFRFRFARPEVREILSFSGKQIYNKVIVNQNAEENYGIVTVKLADISTRLACMGCLYHTCSHFRSLNFRTWQRMISGYNTATKEEKAKYNEKRLCKTNGIGMAPMS